MIYQLAHCVNSRCLFIKMTVNVYKMLRVKGPSEVGPLMFPDSMCLGEGLYVDLFLICAL